MKPPLARSAGRPAGRTDRILGFGRLGPARTCTTPPARATINHSQPSIWRRPTSERTETCAGLKFEYNLRWPPKQFTCHQTAQTNGAAGSDRFAGLEFEACVMNGPLRRQFVAAIVRPACASLNEPICRQRPFPFVCR